MIQNRHNNRTKRTFTTLKEALKTIREELIDCNFVTSRSFWVQGKKYIYRKTNVSTGIVNLTQVV